MRRVLVAVALVAASLLAAAGAVTGVGVYHALDRETFAHAVADTFRSVQGTYQSTVIAQAYLSEAYRLHGPTQGQTSGIPFTVPPFVAAAVAAEMARPETEARLLANGRALFDELMATTAPSALYVDLRFLEEPVTAVVLRVDPTNAPPLRDPGVFVIPPQRLGHSAALGAGAWLARTLHDNPWIPPVLILLAALLIGVAVRVSTDRRGTLRWAGRAMVLAALLTYLGTHGMTFLLERGVTSVESNLIANVLFRLVEGWWLAVLVLLLAAVGLTLAARAPRGPAPATDG
jgi:hypothetical protein